MDCIFCKIAGGEIPSNTVFENDNFRVFLDAAPANLGHCLVVPKKHAENIFDIDDEALKEGICIARKTAKAVKSALNAEGVNVIQNNGEAAGQTVHHFHIHIIPRFEADNVIINFNSKSSTKEESEKIKDKIKKCY